MIFLWQQFCIFTLRENSAKKSVTLCFSASYSGGRSFDSGPSFLLLEMMSVALVRVPMGMMK